MAEILQKIQKLKNTQKSSKKNHKSWLPRYLQKLPPKVRKPQSLQKGGIKNHHMKRDMKSSYEVYMKRMVSYLSLVAPYLPQFDVIVCACSCQSEITVVGHCLEVTGVDGLGAVPRYLRQLKLHHLLWKTKQKTLQRQRCTWQTQANKKQEKETIQEQQK